MEKLKKETVWRKMVIDICAVSFFMFIVPYICNLFIYGIYQKEEDILVSEGREVIVLTPAGEEILPLEEYLIGALAGSAPVTYEDETLKAMAVILRTNALTSDVSKIININQTNYFDSVEQKKLWGGEYAANYRKLAGVVADTNRTVLVYDGELIYAPFFDVSSSSTRPGSELGGDYPYLVSVDSSQDVIADNYLTEKILDINELGKEVCIEEITAQGYVLRIVTDGVSYTGEEFRKKHELLSSNFTIEKQQNRYLVTVKGVGHGFGFSRFGANEMAKKGTDFKHLLEYYYQGVKLEKK